MGYSNNKWRKILYILMIINLCFILFAKITKSFGATSIIIDSPSQYTFNLDSKFDDYTYIYIFYNPDYINNSTTPAQHQMPFYFCASKTPITFRQAMQNYGSTPYLTTYIKTEDNSSFYSFALNTSINNDFITNITRFNNAVNSNASLHNSNSSGFTFENGNVTTNTQFDNVVGLYISSDIEFENGDIAFPNTVVKYPEIANTQLQLETLDFDVLSINAWDYSNEDFDVLFYDLNYGSDTTESLYPVNVITLNKDSLYYNSALTSDSDKNAIYWIPIEEIGFNWVKGNKYGIKFAVRDYGIQGGGGFRGDDFIYQYIGEETVFIISNTVSDNTISALNNSTQNNIQNNQHEEIINNMNNITNNLDNLNDALTNSNPDSSVSSDIDSSLNFDNQNEGLNNLNNGFFSRLTTMLSNLLGYDLGQDTSVSIPLPNSNKSIILHSIDIYNNVTGTLRLIINAFWVYIFSFYMWKFINKIYIAVSTGNILDTFSSSGEAITNDML